MAGIPQADDDFHLGTEPGPVAPEPDTDPLQDVLPPEVKVRQFGKTITDPKDQNKVLANPIRVEQRQLSFFGKWELTKFLAKAFNEVLRMQEGQVTLWQFLAAIGVDDVDSISDVEKAVRSDVLIRGAARLAEVVPDFLEDLFCIVLQISREQREYAKMTFRRPVAEGGFSDEEGFDILNTAFEQNAKAFRDFFGHATEAFEKGRNLLAPQLSSTQ